jgi:hypothetical protein
MIRSFIWIAVLIAIAFSYSIWTAIGVFLLCVIIQFFLVVIQEEVRIRREAAESTSDWYDHPDPAVADQLFKWQERRWRRESRQESRREAWRSRREAWRKMGIGERIYVTFVFGFLIVLLAMMLIGIVSPTHAQIVPNRGPIMILPPVEYDREYEGDLTIKIVDTFEELYALCNQRKPSMLGCAYPSYADNYKSCIIILLKDETMRKYGWTTGLLLRHERGHCHGWPGDHPGQRELTGDTFWMAPAQRVKIPQDRLDRANKVKESAAGPQ